MQATCHCSGNIPPRHPQSSGREVSSRNLGSHGSSGCPNYSGGPGRLCLNASFPKEAERMVEEALDDCCEQAALCPLCPASPGRAAAGPLPSPNSFLLPFYDPELPPIHLPARAAASPHPMPARPGGMGKRCGRRGSLRMKLQEEGGNSIEPISWKDAQDIHWNW